MNGPDRILVRAHAARDDNPAILRDCFANRFQAFRLGAVQKPTGVHNDHIRPIVGGGEVVAFGTQARQDPLGIHQRLGTAQTDKPDFTGGCFGRVAHGGG